MNPPAESPRTLRACYWVLGCFLFVCVYYVGIYPGAPDSNQRSHFQLLRALAERGTAEIGPELNDLGWHTDVALHAGRRYSNKAPGLSVAAVPAYRLLRIFLPAPKSPQDWLVFYGARLLSVTLVVMLAVTAFVRHAWRIVPACPLLPIWLFGLLFATPFQVYARSFFSHAFVAALLLLSFLLVDRHDGILAALSGGFLAGAAVASEYPAGVIALCLLVLAATKTPKARLVAFVCGAAVAGALLAFYHARYFGSVFAFPPAASETYSLLASRGIAGVSFPSPAALWGLFADPAHGLLYFSPFLVLWPVVAVQALRGLRRDPSLMVPSLGPLLLALVIAGFLPPHWRGGWCLGPRYLVAGLLLVFWLLLVRIPAVSTRLPRVLLLSGIVYGVILLVVCGSTFWMIPYEAWNPARTVSAHFLRLGIVEYNVGLAAGLPPLLSLVPPVLATGVAFIAAVRGSAVKISTLVAATVLAFLSATVVLSIRPSPAAIASSHREGLASVLLPAMRAGWR